MESVKIDGFPFIKKNVSSLLIAMKAHKPTDATTNPSLILSAAQQEQYQHLIERAVKHGNKTGT